MIIIIIFLFSIYSFPIFYIDLILKIIIYLSEFIYLVYLKYVWYSKKYYKRVS